MPFWRIMKPASFSLKRPRTLEEALATAAAHSHDFMWLAGGQSLVPILNFRLAAPAVLIDLNAVSDLDYVHVDGDSLRIGAMTRQATLLTNPLIQDCVPLLAKAVSHVGHVQTRSRGTIGGSIAHADPSAEIPLCAVALGATVVLTSASGQRILAAHEFFRDALVTAIEPGELLTEIVIPRRQSSSSVFREITRRHGDFGIVSVAIDAAPNRFQVAVGGLEKVPHRCMKLSSAASSGQIGRRDIASLIDDECADVSPLSDLHASGEYRLHLAKVLLRDCLEEVLKGRPRA